MWNDKLYKPFIAICILCILGNMFWDKQILNFPYEIWFGYPFLLVIALSINATKYKTKLTLRFLGTTCFMVLIFFYFIIHLPLAAIIIYSSDDSNCETYSCEILSLGRSSRDRSVTYDFFGSGYKFYNYQPYKGFSLERDELDNYYIELLACEARFNSYIKRSLVLKEK